MSNQLTFWSMLVVPFVTLLWMKKEDIRRYLPVGLFAAITSVIMGDIGITLGFWVHRETAYPLHSVMPFDIGLNLVLPMWIFKFTHRRFWLYLITNAVLDIGFAFFAFPRLFPGIGMLSVTIPPLKLYLVVVGHALLLYGYQLWYESILAPSGKTDAALNLRPAAAKPLPGQEDDDME